MLEVYFSATLHQIYTKICFQKGIGHTRAFRSGITGYIILKGDSAFRIYVTFETNLNEFFFFFFLRQCIKSDFIIVRLSVIGYS